MADINVKKGRGDTGKVRAKKQSTRVDMTPLADLGFLLITFFMFTTTFSKPNVMGLNMPPKKPDDEILKPDEEPQIDLTNSISVVIGGNNKLYWHQKDKTKLEVTEFNETNYSKDGLRKEIIAAKKRAKDVEKFTVIIKPTDDSNYENLVNVLDEMEITDSERYGIVDPGPREIEVYQQVSGIAPSAPAANTESE